MGQDKANSSRGRQLWAPWRGPLPAPRTRGGSSSPSSDSESYLQLLSGGQEIFSQFVGGFQGGQHCAHPTREGERDSKKLRKREGEVTESKKERERAKERVKVRERERARKRESVRERERRREKSRETK